VGDFIKAVFIASLIFFSFAYFIPNVRFSRLAFIATCGVLVILIPGWRWLFPMTANWLNTAIAKKNRVVIVGTGQMANQVYDKLFSISPSKSNFKGFIAESDHLPSINRTMIIGHIKDIKNIVKTVKINEIIVAASEKSDFDFMGLINYCTKNNIILKMVQGMHEDGKYCILDVNMSETVVI
jgi:FlaA1/EpsC-like NDP-sugar epimerase